MDYGPKGRLRRLHFQSLEIRKICKQYNRDGKSKASDESTYGPTKHQR